MREDCTSENSELNPTSSLIRSLIILLFHLISFFSLLVYMDSRSSQLPDSSNLNHSVQQEVLNSAPSLSSSSNSHVHSLIADLYSSVANIMEDQEEIINSYLYFQVLFPTILTHNILIACLYIFQLFFFPTIIV